MPRPRPRPRALAAALALTALAPALLAGCGSAVDGGRRPFEEMVDNGLTKYVGAAKSSVDLRDGDVTEYAFDPASGPLCLHGGTFHAATRDQGSDDLLIYLQGGGACWHDLCVAVDEAPANTGVPEAGILDTKLAANPVRTWNIGYVPYCDGSLFSGDVDIDDDGDGTIDRYHRGLRNLSAALDVIHTAFPHPKRILLTGASAGAYGTVLATALVRQYYPTPDLMVIADGSAGLGKPEDPGFVTSLLAEWNIAHLLPASCVDCVADGNLTKLIAWGLDQDPTIEMGTISSYGDFVIGTTFLGIGPDAYGEAVRAATGSLAASHPQRYHRFLFAGTKHTTISIDSTTNLDDVDFNGLPLSGGLGEILGRFDVTAVEGVTVADWVGYLVAGSPMWVDELAPASAH